MINKAIFKDKLSLLECTKHQGNKISRINLTKKAKRFLYCPQCLIEEGHQLEQITPNLQNIDTFVENLYSGGGVVLQKKIQDLIDQARDYQQQIEEITTQVDLKLEKDLLQIEQDITSQIRQKFKEIRQQLQKQYKNNIEPINKNLFDSISIFEKEQSKIDAFGLEGNQELINSLNTCMGQESMFVELSQDYLNKISTFEKQLSESVFYQHYKNFYNELGKLNMSGKLLTASSFCI